jgi:hypothetical protein
MATSSIMNVISIVFWPPHFGEQMPVGDDLARVAGEQAQQSVFDGRERRFFVGYLHQTLGEVDDKGPRHKHLLRQILSGSGAVENRLHASRQLIHVARFDYVIVCSQVETTHNVIDSGLGGLHRTGLQTVRPISP